MLELVAASVVAFGVVFVAELGDKTQLLALGFGARHPLRVVAVGLTLGYGVANLVAVVVGGVLGAALPDRPIQIVSGAVFLGFAALALRRAFDATDVTEPDDGSLADSDDPPPAPAVRSPWYAAGPIGLAIAIAEMGDKTQITTATLASQSTPVGVWIGATLGAAASGMIGAAAGRSVGHRISERAISLASALLFAAFGLVMLAGWF